MFLSVGVGAAAACADVAESHIICLQWAAGKSASRTLRTPRACRQGARKMSLEERKVRRRALTDLGVPDFWSFIEQQQAEAPPPAAPACGAATAPAADAEPLLSRRPTETMQASRRRALSFFTPVFSIFFHTHPGE